MTDWYKIKRVLTWQGWVEKQIYPAGWEPNANTVAYYPLTSDFSDASWNSRNLTNSWATITTQWWRACWYWNGSSYAEYSWYWLTNTARTINVWCYCTQASNTQWVVHISTYSVIAPSWSLWVKFNLWNTNVWPWDWTNASAESVTANVTAWWHNIIVTQSWNTTKLYIDWSLIWTISNYPSEANTPNWWSLWSKYYSAHSEKLTWYLSAVILENKVRTAQEISDYYNLTKSTYGL